MVGFAAADVKLAGPVQAYVPPATFTFVVKLIGLPAQTGVLAEAVIETGTYVRNVAATVADCPTAPIVAPFGVNSVSDPESVIPLSPPATLIVGVPDVIAT